MKKALILSLAFLSTMILYGQQITKKANTIIISNSLSRDPLYDKINNVLFENGYGILTSDKSNGTISTTEKSFMYGVLKLNILVKDNSILLRGDFKIPISIDYGGASSEPSYQVIQYLGMKKSPSMIAWNEMVRISDAIPGKKEYLLK